MGFRDIDSREAILAAVDEFDRLGKERFLEKYGYGDAISFFLVIDDKRYPSKAIVGVAHGFQFPDRGALKYSEFQGGREVLRKLESLGFTVILERDGLEVEIPDFVVNNRYYRTLIHSRFGGQRQGGISTPGGKNFIFLFTGESGEQYGYSDGWTTDGIFFYTGEGQVGNMEFAQGNKAIRDHAEDGRDLYLFKYVDRGLVAYVGEFICTGYHFREGPDINGNSRKIIVFELAPLDYFKTIQDIDFGKIDEEESLEHLRAKALSTTIISQTPIERKTYSYRRSQAIQLYALKRANGICEGCGKPAPFIKNDGQPYLEIHHIRKLSDGGPDHPEWVAATCPNCHSRAHYSQDSVEFNKKLHNIVSNKESRSKRLGL